MKVYVIDASAYDDGQVEGVFASRDLALKWLGENGYHPCEDRCNERDECGCCPHDGDWFHDSEGWLKATILEFDLVEALKDGGDSA